MNHIPMMEDLTRQVAQSLDATPDLLPFLPDLLADTWALGGSPSVIVDVLRTVTPSSPLKRVLDVGCGKGAVAIAVAKELGCRVRGVDAFPPFIEEARKRAQQEGVSALCRFERADMREEVRAARGYDGVIYASHGPMLDGEPCVDLLRQCVEPGGYIVLDDGFLAGAVTPKPPGYEAYLPHQETVARLTAHGDLLVREVVLSVEERDMLNREVTSGIRARAEALAARHPEAADLFFGYVQRQEEECRTLREVHVPAVWLLKRR